MTLTDAQFGTLHRLAEHGPAEAIEVAGPRGMDDAHLIAAAPDLYAALERMLGVAGYTDDNSITRQAKAALAKARGERT